jgi:hypothetical protein
MTRVEATTGPSSEPSLEPEDLDSPSIKGESREARTRFLALLLVVVVIGVGIRIAYVESVAHHLKFGFDALAYQILGAELADGLGYSNPGLIFAHTHAPTANFPPGYPLFLAVLDRLHVGSPGDVELAGALVGGVTVVATGFLGRRLTDRRSVGILAALLVALSPTLIASSVSSMSESLSVPLIVLVLLAATWAARSRTVASWSVVGLLAGCLDLVRSEDLLVAVILMPVVCLLSPGRSWRWRGV